jgi:hypothetical protein
MLSTTTNIIYQSVSHHNPMSLQEAMEFVGQMLLGVLR